MPFCAPHGENQLLMANSASQCRVDDKQDQSFEQGAFPPRASAAEPVPTLSYQTSSVGQLHIIGNQTADRL
jgi:hypothetical protein